MRATKREEILALLHEHRAELTKLGAKSLAVFGSVARDQVREDSDVDVLVEFEQPPTFDHYMDLKFYIEDLLGRSVDLVPRNKLRIEIRPAVEGEAIHVT
ncbi:MAG: nucleotidyltransferase family protein [Anaerolineae bacterium]